MPDQVTLSPKTIAWKHEVQSDYHSGLMDSGSEQEDIATEDDVVPIDFSRVSDDLLRLVRRTYHLYTAYRIMNPIQHYRYRTSKRWRTLSPALNVSQGDEENSDIETYARRLKKMCNGGNFAEGDGSNDGSDEPVESDSSESDSDLFEAKDTASVQGLFQPEADCTVDLSEEPDDVLISHVLDDSKKHDLMVKQQHNVILESLMKDLCNINSRLAGNRPKASNSNNGSSSSSSNNSSKVYEADDKDCVTTGDNLLADNILLGEKEEQQSPTINSTPVRSDQRTYQEEIGIVSNDLPCPLLLQEERLELRSPVKDGRDLKLSRSPLSRLPSLATRYSDTATNWLNGHGNAVRRCAWHDELRNSTRRQQQCFVSKHRKMRSTTGRALALAGDEAHSRRLTRLEFAKRHAAVGPTASAFESDGGLRCFVVLERLEDVVARTEQMEDSSLSSSSPREWYDGEESSVRRQSNNNTINNNSNNNIVDSSRIVINDRSSIANRGGSRSDYCAASGGVAVGLQEQKSSTFDIQSHSKLVREQKLEPGIWKPHAESYQTSESYSNTDGKAHDVSGSSSLPDVSPSSRSRYSSGPVSHSEDDEGGGGGGDPPLFADLFGRSSRNHRRTSRGEGRRINRPAILASSLACTFMSVASAILSARKRLETPCRRSERMVSRDSGFVDSEDSRGSIAGGESRLDEYWIRRRKHWEVTDIREEVRELLGFVPRDSPPRVMPPLHIPSAQKVVVPTKRKAATRSLKKAVSPPPSIDINGGGGGGGGSRSSSSCCSSSGSSKEPKVKRTRKLVAPDEGNVWLSRDTLNAKLTVSKRSGRSIRPPAHMDM